MSRSDENDVTAETAAEEYASLEQNPPAPAEPVEPPVSRTRRVAITLAALLAVSVALTCWLYFGTYRADQRLGVEAEQAAMAAAADGAVAVLTYSPKTLEKDFAAAERHLTGDFLSYYTDFTQKVVTPAAKQKEVQTMASVVRKGIVSLQPTHAEVLVFINQTTISKSNPDGAFSMSSVKVGLEKHDGRWLISSFDPV
ncbi:twin-arginine translocation pathway signal [[Mycobacterium] crassicus]|uniref:Twin-arginine translocation pathway signal n=1 Tax=[Mycobacterium] crassicus TaxID=2872309 RepID=A0ABU5XBR8_9MYCO|nr:twin-arginine translocation pathway signal [Mycolicibacter sp. MYC098]MEB3019573.1 twin-arginine translocation pathway signal [Mycolicibacter sp. MYC098]